ncbi:tRNA-binding protein [Nonlabens tegetincola]|uniref:tRNA-binding protein n=1 Tax=Nonlabens tegetincola TaxID=323273 RepID=UPI000CF39919|nr:tRNA-binding protein [Nonlabens tegetincola]PQJ14239.1 tRNA-binding protein [Nonlabens tegetincola]
MNKLTWSEFEKVDMRVGTIIDAQPFPEVRNPAYKLYIDFGDLGVKKTSAQITNRYKLQELIGKQVIAVVNFPPKQIANFMSECLVLGVVGVDKDVILLQPGALAKNGDRIG